MGGDFMKLKNGKFGSGVPDANWGLNEGIGDRVFTQHIDFGEDLLEVPVVVLGITEIESTFDPVRVAVEAKTLTFGASTRKSEPGLTHTSYPVADTG
jgi:hypothetical protein